MPMEFWPHIHKSFYVPFFPFSECLENVFHMLVHEEQKALWTRKLHQISTPWKWLCACKTRRNNCVRKFNKCRWWKHLCAIVYKIASTIAARLWWTNSHCHATDWKPVITQLRMNPNWGLILGFTLLIHLCLINPCSVLDFCYEDGIWEGE